MNQFEAPPSLRGTAETQLGQLYTYLYQLSELLNVSFEGVNQSAGGGTNSKNTGGSSTKGTGDIGSEVQDLKSLIVNTAQIVRVNMNKLETKLTEKYEAQSAAFGDFTENIETTITATARDVLSIYGYDAAIASLQEESSGLKQYQLETEGFIRQGFIDYDDNGVPIIGIAIGQNLSSVAETVGGVTLQHIDRNQNCAFYTSERVSFRVNGREAAYASNQKFYMVDAQVVGTLSLGDGWDISATAANGVVFRYIGG